MSVRTFWILAICGVSTACESNPSVKWVEPTPILVSAPVRAVYTFPKNGSELVPREARIEAAFSEALDPNSVDSSSFILEPESGPAVTGAVLTSGVVATFVPSSPLLAHHQYTATLTTTITAADGRELESPRVWTFTTGGLVAFRATMSGTAAPAPDTTTRISLPNEAYDHGNNFDTGTSVFVAPVNGLYEFNVRLVLDNPSDADDQTWYVALGLNGTGLNEILSHQLGIGHKGAMGRNGSARIQLNAGESVELTTSLNGVGGNRVLSGGVLEGVLISPL